MWVFEPPVVEEGPAGQGPLFSRYRLRRGVTVLIKDGVVSEHRFPFQELVMDADFSYLGGRKYEVSEAEKDLLQAAGYSLVQITS